MGPALSFKQIIQALIVLTLMIVIAWLAFYVLVVILVIAAFSGAAMMIYRFLVDRGIVKSPRSRQSSADMAADVTVIETDYHEVKTTDDPASKS